jgi:hypothetical protein
MTFLGEKNCPIVEKLTKRAYGKIVIFAQNSAKCQ